MEHAIWKGKVLSASEIAADFGTEKSIRNASRNKELLCPDPGCQQRLLKYCHGDVKEAYFAHVHQGSCDYACFDRETTPLIRFVQQKLYEHFKNQGYDIQQEFKIFPHHYVHLLLNLEDNRKLAIEIGTQNTTQQKIQRLSEKYEKSNLAVRWIIIGNPKERLREDHVCFIKRQQLNEARNNDLFIIDESGNLIAQCRMVGERYTYKNQTMEYPICQGYGSLDSLCISEADFAIPNFEKNYADWIQKKQAAFRSRVDEAEEQEKLRRKLAEEERNRFEANKNRYQGGKPISSPKPKSPIDCYQKRREEILPKMNQTQEPVWDYMDKRWIRCKECGKIAESDEFDLYGGPNEATLGICRDCMRKNSKK